MTTSASMLNHEEEVPSIVEGDDTTLATGSEGAAIEVAATGYQGFLKCQPRKQVRIASTVTQANIDERFILEIVAQGVKTIADFVCLKGTEAEMRNTLASSFGIDVTKVKFKVAIGRALNAWRSATYRASEYEAGSVTTPSFTSSARVLESSGLERSGNWVHFPDCNFIGFIVFWEQYGLLGFHGKLGIYSGAFPSVVQADGVAGSNTAYVGRFYESANASILQSSREDWQVPHKTSTNFTRWHWLVWSSASSLV